jgi:hypothetical protein
VASACLQNGAFDDDCCTSQGEGSCTAGYRFYTTGGCGFAWAYWPTCCTPTVIDLDTISSPFSGSTTGNTDDVSVCGNGADQGFSYELEPGEIILIWQTSNTFDSQHTLRYGGEYPGDSEVSCVDDPDTLSEGASAQLAYQNDGGSTTPVYFVVDAFGSNDFGDFTLAWEIRATSAAPTGKLYLLTAI